MFTREAMKSSINMRINLVHRLRTVKEDTPLYIGRYIQAAFTFCSGAATRPLSKVVELLVVHFAARRRKAQSSTPLKFLLQVEVAAEVARRHGNYKQFTVDGGPLTAAGRFYFLLLQLRLATVLK